MYSSALGTTIRWNLPGGSTDAVLKKQYPCRDEDSALPEVMRPPDAAMDSNNTFQYKVFRLGTQVQHFVGSFLWGKNDEYLEKSDNDRQTTRKQAFHSGVIPFFCNLQ